MSTSSFELLTCEECWRFHCFLKWCPLSAFLPLSGRASQYSREALQKAEFPLWFCHRHPALLFPLQSRQILSAVWKQHVLAGGVSLSLPKVLTKMLGFILYAPVSPCSASFWPELSWWSDTDLCPDMSLCGWPHLTVLTASIPSLLLPTEELDECHSFFFLYPFVCF